MKSSLVDLNPHFARLGIVLHPDDDRQRVINPASARLRDGSLQLYPRMVAPGNISRIGSFRAKEKQDGTLQLEDCGYALEPKAPYELRNVPGGYGCEDPRVTYISALDKYVMAYVAFGPRGPEVAVAISEDGLAWERLGLMCFRQSLARFADKDAAFFPEPIVSPKGVASLAFYHRPTRPWPTKSAIPIIPPFHEGISIGYVALDPARKDPAKLCEVGETHRLKMPRADWGTIKVGAGTPPVRTNQGWLGVIHGVDPVRDESGASLQRYCAGIIIHDTERLDRIIYRSPTPLFVPEVPGEISGTVGRVVFPTAIDPRPDLTKGTFDIYYGMADYEIGRGRLTLT